MINLKLLIRQIWSINQQPLSRRASALRENTGDGAQWWQYLNIEYRFINGSWDNSYQRAASVYGGSVCCASGYVTGENTDDSISYSYKTVFEIFAPYEWGVSEQFAINGDIPLWISCVAESGWKWLIEFNQDTNAPQTVTNEGFVRK